MESSRSRALLTRSRIALRAFSLVELLVVLSIIAIVTSIALVGQSSFNRSILLTDAAYTMALSFREMQSLGLSSRKVGGVQDAGYGVYFGTISSGVGLSSYTLFGDTYDDPTPSGVPANCEVGVAGTPEHKPGDCIYTAGQDQIIQSYQFSRGVTVDQYCGRSGANTRCSSDASNPLSSLHIVFLRSTTETAFVGYREGEGWIVLSDAQIRLKPQGADEQRHVCLSVVGQISVSTTGCP